MDKIYPGTFTFQKGQLVRDKITGFRGVITGRADYLTGCNTYGLTPMCDDEDQLVTKKPSTEWFDESRLVLITDNVVSPASVQGPVKGGPHSKDECAPNK